MDAHVQECAEVCGVIFYLRRGVLVQGAAAGVGMRKPLSGDSGFFQYVSRPAWLYTRLTNNSGFFSCHFFIAGIGVSLLRARCGMLWL